MHFDKPSEPPELLACLDCRVAQPSSALAQPIGGAASNGSLPSCDREFLAAHTRHRIASLRRREAALCSEQRWRRRQASISFAASDGQQVFLITGEALGDAEKPTYSLHPATLRIKNPILAVDEETIRRRLAAALFPYRLRPTKFRGFMRVLQGIIREVSESDLDLVYDGADDLNVSIARLPDSAYAELTTRSAAVFDSWEFPRIEQFLALDRHQEGLLALRVQREIAALDA